MTPFLGTDLARSPQCLDVCIYVLPAGQNATHILPWLELRRVDTQRVML